MNTLHLKVVISSRLSLILPAVKRAIKINQGKVVGIETMPDPISINRSIKRNQANLLILSTDEKESTCEIILEIKRKHPLIKIVIIAANCMMIPMIIKTKMVEAIITIHESIEDLIQVIFLVKCGKKYYPAETGEEIDKEVATKNLTHREVQIFNLLEKSLSKKEIAEILGIKIETVRTHARNLNAKLPAKTTEQPPIMHRVG